MAQLSLWPTQPSDGELIAQTIAQNWPWAALTMALIAFGTICVLWGPHELADMVRGVRTWLRDAPRPPRDPERYRIGATLDVESRRPRPFHPIRTGRRPER